MEIILKHPLQLGEKTKLEKLTLRDYTTAADYLSFDRRGGVAQRIALIASLSGQDESVIERLRGSDYRRAEQVSEKLMTQDEADAYSDKEIFPDEKTPEQLEAEKK